MVEWILSSSILAAVFIAIRYLFKGRIKAIIQYALWGILLIRLLVPFSFGASSLSVENLIRQENVRIEEMQNGNHPKSDGTILAFEDETADSANAFAAQNAQQERGPMGGLKETPTTLKAPFSHAQIFMILWLAGTVCVLAWFLFCNLRFSRWLKNGRNKVDAAFFGIDTRQQKQIPGAKPLPVYRPAALETPCLFGIFHPAVYVTEEVCQSESTFKHVLIHENIHFRHGDHLWAILRGICIAVHWFNPLVWWAASLSKRDCELACDETTLRILGEAERENYGRTLINVTSLHSPAILMTATSMSGKKSVIRERVEMIAGKKRKSMISAFAVLLIAVIAIGCTFTGAAEIKKQDAAQEAFEAQLRSDTDSGILVPYSAQNETWVTENDNSYRYRYSLTGRMNNAALDTTFVVLSNKETVTFEQCVQDIFSSNSEEHFQPEETVIAAMYAGEAPEADIRVQFLKWRFTANQDDRWINYQQEIDAVMKETPAPQPEEGQYGIIPLPMEQQEKVEAAAAAYYSPVQGIASEELLGQMAKSRVPMSEDELFANYGVETTFLDASFEQGQTDPFAPGIVYDFEARILVSGYEDIPNFPYQPDEAGHIHRTGQITVENGVITNIHVKR